MAPRFMAALPATLALAGLACLRGGTEPRAARAPDPLEPVVLAPTSVAADGTLTDRRRVPDDRALRRVRAQSLQGARLAVEELQPRRAA